MTNSIALTTSASSLKRFLKHIQDAGVPPKVDRPYLKSVGFKSGNDGYLIPILKSLGFVNAQGIPENAWKSYRDKKRAPIVLGQAVRRAYADLFGTYPDAYRKDEEAIRNWVRSKSDFDEVKVGHAVTTFKTLCELASFEGDAADPDATSVETDAIVTPHAPLVVAPQHVPGRPSAPGQPVININIELHLPPSQDGESYEKLFEAMKNHLFPDESTSS